MVSQAHLDAFDRVDRVTQDKGQFKCRKGTPCNGRCIPRGHECGVDTTGSPKFEKRTRQAKFGAGAVGVGAVMAAAAEFGYAREKRAKRQKIIQGLRENVKPAPSVSDREHQQNLEKVRKPGQEV
jgi:hypothetical protein